MKSADSINRGGRFSCLFLRYMSQCQKKKKTSIWHKAAYDVICICVIWRLFKNVTFIINKIKLFIKKNNNY